MISERREKALVERDPGLLPAVCRSCGRVLGLAAIGEALRCVDCGLWVEPDDDLGADVRMLG